MLRINFGPCFQNYYVSEFILAKTAEKVALHRRIHSTKAPFRLIFRLQMIGSTGNPYRFFGFLFSFRHPCMEKGMNMTVSTIQLK